MAARDAESLLDMGQEVLRGERLGHDLVAPGNAACGPIGRGTLYRGLPDLEVMRHCWLCQAFSTAAQPDMA